MPTGKVSEVMTVLTIVRTLFRAGAETLDFSLTKSLHKRTATLILTVEHQKPSRVLSKDHWQLQEELNPTLILLSSL